MGEFTLVVYVCESSQDNQLSYYQAQIQQLSHMWIHGGHEGTRLATEYPRCILLRMKSWYCSKTQRPWNSSVTHCNEHLQIKMFGQNGMLWDTLKLASTARVFKNLFLSFFSLACVCVCVCRGERHCRGRGRIPKDGDWGAWCEIQKECVFCFFLSTCAHVCTSLNPAIYYLRHSVRNMDKYID